VEILCAGCNPSNSEGRDEEDCGSKPAQLLFLNFKIKYLDCEPRSNKSENSIQRQSEIFFLWSVGFNLLNPSAIVSFSFVIALVFQFSKIPKSRIRVVFISKLLFFFNKKI
jgi:threonine/homoserine/homoserine lactone efflux protein